MRPAAPRLADTAAHDEEIDDPPICHVHMIPVIDPGTEDDHRPAFGLFRIGRKFTRDGDDAISRYTGYFFGPRRRIRFILVIALGQIFAAQSAVETVICHEQVINRSDQSSPLGQLHAFYGNPADELIRMVCSFKIIMIAITEFGKTTIKTGVWFFFRMLVRLSFVSFSVVSFSSRF